MDKVWSLIFDIFTGIVIVFLSAALYFDLRTDSAKKSLVRDATQDFVQTAKHKGSITVNDYENLLARLSITNEIYDINLEYQYTAYEPEYRFRTLEEILEAQKAAYKGENEYHYRDVITYHPAVNDPVNNENLNTETNESVLASAVNTPADPKHIHTDECYHGTKHIHTGNSTSGGGCYAKTGSGHTCGGSLSLYRQETYTDYVPCVVGCGGTVTCVTIVGYFRCSNGHSVSATIYEGVFCDANSEHCAEKYYDISSCGAYMTEYRLNCGKIEGHYYNGDKEVFPICDQLAVSIEPTHPVQKVATGDPLITTVRATYLDGSTKVVLGRADFSTARPCDHQTATITYTYTLDGNTYTKTCTVDVTVIPRTRICSRGHLYNLNADGSDPGCPYCRAWVDNIRVIYPETSTMTITIGTTLQDNGVKLLVTYMDGRTEVLTSGYDDNLDMAYLGTMTVTIGYKGAVTYLLVTTVCAKTRCEICGREYDLYPDRTDPGCPYCIQKIPVFTGKVLTYEEKEYTDAILDNLYSKGIYNMQTDDTFTIIVKNKSLSESRKLIQRIFPSLSDNWIVYKMSEKIGAK